mmetsp:Transcript_28191/g.27171  ORF Transcript_28191/g.27171 Transcript_28191/m.27171 type:complete len:119 (-) Transcript_28191:102-458(-)
MSSKHLPLPQSEDLLTHCGRQLLSNQSLDYSSLSRGNLESTTKRESLSHFYEKHGSTFSSSSLSISTSTINNDVDFMSDSQAPVQSVMLESLGASNFETVPAKKNLLFEDFKLLSFLG